MPRQVRTKPSLDLKQGRLTGILDKGDFGIPTAELSAVAIKVLRSRYLLRDGSGQVSETPRQLFERVARAVSAVEKKFNSAISGERLDEIGRDFFELMASLRFLPNSPTLMNAGKPKGQLSACFVLPLQDDLGQVFETLREAAVIHKTGGGTGFNFGNLRPQGDLVHSSGGQASGPLAFLRIFDTATDVVKQGGTRRGANMAILPVSHPDIEAFIASKREGGIANFNISVAISDDFMRAVKQRAKWPLVNPRTGQVLRSVPARRLWNAIAEGAWKSGDPGVVFLDEINDKNPTPRVGRMESTNPCGEQPLLPYESCNLGSLNLAAYVNGKSLNWAQLERDVATAVRFLDNIIEANHYPVKAIEEITLGNRKIGLGVMGWADVLLEWEIPYGSAEAIQAADETMSRLSRLAVQASEGLAKERGAFANFKGSLWDKRGDAPRRNATVTTIAPTGTISLIAGVSSGIEPVYSLAFEREGLEGQRMIFVHPTVKRILRRAKIKSKRAILEVLDSGSVAHLKELPARTRKVFQTAMEIDPLWHVRMQAAFQKHTENGVSKTINLPASATPATVKRIYEEAFEQKCKGITVFRDWSKPTQVLRKGITRSKELDAAVRELRG